MSPWRKKAAGTVGGFWSEIKELLRDRKAAALLIPLVAIWVVIQIETLPFGLTKESGCKMQDAQHSSQVEHLVYSWLMRFRFSSDEANHVALVTISDNFEPLSVLTNTCVSRLVVSDLVRKLEALQAAVIVVDLSYSDKSCLDPKVNKELREAFTQRNNSAVVVGQATHPRRDAANQDDCLVINKSFDFTPSQPSHGPFRQVQFGLTRLNRDVLKIPLYWWAFNKDEDTEVVKSRSQGNSEEELTESALAPFGRYYPSLALVAAEAAVNNAPKQDLKLAIDSPTDFKREHPYGTFLQEIPTWTATDLLCDRASNDPSLSRDPLKAELWASLRCNEVDHLPFDKLRGKVVVIGEHISTELKPFPGEERYGSDLQANYIECLLTGRLKNYAPVWDWTLVIISISTTMFLTAMSIRKRIGEWPIYGLQWMMLIVFLSISVLLLIKFDKFTPHFLLLCGPIVGALISQLAVMLIRVHSEENPGSKPEQPRTTL